MRIRIGNKEDSVLDASSAVRDQGAAAAGIDDAGVGAFVDDADANDDDAVVGVEEDVVVAVAARARSRSVLRTEETTISGKCGLLVLDARRSI